MDQASNVNDAVMAKLKAKGASGRVALVGASTNPSKYGNIIIKNLVQKGFEVVPINPKESTIEGLTAYPSLLDVPEPVGIVNFVVPPPVTMKVLEAIRDQGFDTVWLQDGSFDDDVIAFAKEHFDNVVHHACIMVVTNYT